MSPSTPSSIVELPATNSLSASEIAAALDNISCASIGVLGDFCLDAYWMINSEAGEPSVETGLVTRPVHSHRYSPGGAGNVVMNLLALEVPKIHVFGVLGSDPFGRELDRLLTHPDVVRAGLLVQAENWQTHVYAKPFLDMRESYRIDFGDFNRLSDETALQLLKTLEGALPQLSVVLINHQVAGSLHNSEPFRMGLNDLIQSHPEVCFIVDSRGYHDAYPGAVHKLNEAEVLKQSGRDLESGEVLSLHDLVCHAAGLRDRWNAPLVVTRGPKGCLVIDQHEPEQIFGLQTLGKIDSVGAGDTFVSTFAAIVGSGTNLTAAAFIANIAASVTVQKVFQTGTASPTEILELGKEANYVYRQELAGSPLAARYLEGSELEIVEEPSPSIQVRYAIFDHDGTISTLRQGWEQIMEPMMLRSIFGGDYAQVDSGTVQRVSNEVRKYIDKTTGIQTIAQMAGLVEMVKEFGYVPQERILDAAGYKHIFNVELKALVNRRLEKLAKGELAIDDFTIKGAVPFLRSLVIAGVTLYLASGTDDADTKEEAQRLGYADLFQGGIFGSVGDITKDAKKIVIQRILTEVGGNYEQLIAFGDGPVEMRETIKRGAYAVGIASDEIRRFGNNLEKRARLICAGAKAVIPDFSQTDRLWKFLRLPGTPL